MRFISFPIRLSFFCLLTFGLAAGAAQAACTSPTAPDGSYYTKSSNKKLYKCNGSTWVLDDGNVDVTKTPPILYGVPRIGADGNNVVTLCNVMPGKPCGGGFYAGDGNLVVAPAGCTNGSPPTCPAGPVTGGVDKVALQFSTSNSPESDNHYSRRQGFGRSNTLNNFAHPAFQYCRTMVYNGYSDWYLPTMFELETVIQIFPEIGGVPDGQDGQYSYWTSNEVGGQAKAITPMDYLHRKGAYLESVANSYNPNKTEYRLVRCVRRN